LPISDRGNDHVCPEHAAVFPDTPALVFEHAGSKPRAYVSPKEIIGWVEDEPLVFKPGSKYEYSNTDNIVVGLMIEAVTGKTYADNLQQIVFGPSKLTQTSLPTKLGLPSPYIHGYVVEPGKEPQDFTNFLSPSGAWARSSARTSSRTSRTSPSGWIRAT